MGRPASNAGADLDASLRRIGDALEQNRTHYAAMAQQVAAARGARAAERIADAAAKIEARTTEATERLASRLADSEARISSKLERRAERLRRREQQRRDHDAREAAAGIPAGIVQAIVAIVCLIYGVLQPTFFWMIFVAAGFGMSAASSFAKAARERRTSREAQASGAAGVQVERRQSVSSSSEEMAAADPAAPGASPPAPAEAEIAAAALPPDPKVARIQGLCDKLLAELESGPPIVREVVTEPHETIAGLRRACVETARRERELRGVLAAQDEAALASERDGLAARVAAEPDAIVRDRLSQALKALEQQLTNRAELATAATRLEAENTRILYTLENLHMQLLRARSTDIGAPELGGKLRESLRALGTQIDAVAEALEWASGPQADAERAERADAARRARAQAQQSSS